MAVTYNDSCDLVISTSVAANSDLEYLGISSIAVSTVSFRLNVFLKNKTYCTIFFMTYIFVAVFTIKNHLIMRIVCVTLPILNEIDSLLLLSFHSQIQMRLCKTQMMFS